MRGPGLEEDKRTLRVIQIGVGIVATFLIDLNTGTQLSVSIFYLIPIAMATWHWSRTAGFVLSIVCASLWLLSDFLLGMEYTNPLIPYWNTLVRLGFFAIITQTLSTQKRYQAALVKARHDALHASRVKSDFVNRVTHELRTPLAAILGFSEMMEKRSASFMTASDRESLRRIRANAMSLTTLVEGVLELGRAEAGVAATKLEPVDLRQIVQGIATDFRARWDSADVQLIVDMPNEVAPLETDSGLLQQILLNLMSNAVKFTELGYVRIGARTDPTHKPVQLYVEDTGIGIAADRVNAIMLPFEQADGSIHARYGGAGLGLAITHDLCRRLGYQLQVDTEQGVGSRFTVLLSA